MHYILTKHYTEILRYILKDISISMAFLTMFCRTIKFSNSSTCRTYLPLSLPSHIYIIVHIRYIYLPCPAACAAICTFLPPLFDNFPFCTTNILSIQILIFLHRLTWKIILANAGLFHPQKWSHSVLGKSRRWAKRFVSTTTFPRVFTRSIYLKKSLCIKFS